MTATEQIKEIAADAQGYLKKIHDSSGKKFVGVMHPVVPQEILHAAGLHPFRLFPFPGESISLAHNHLHVYASSVFRAIWDQVLKEQLPFLDGVVLPESCETVTYFARGWRFHRPQDFLATTAGPRFNKTRNAVDFFTRDLRELASSVASLAGAQITEEGLSRSISVFNEQRRLLREICDLRKGPAPKLTGLEAFEIFLASHVMDKAEGNELLAKVSAELHGREAGVQPKARLLVSGPCLTDLRLLAAMEASGAVVVADDSNFGSRSFVFTVAETGDPYEALAGAYAEIPCPFCTSAERRLELLSEMIGQYKVDGVVFAVEKACESEKMDFPYLERELRCKEIPVSFLETEYLCDVSSFATRIDGFVELITD